jgi:hypothetical protein
MWLQRSRVAWLKVVDRDTGFFHRQARWRARKNKITKLRKVDGTWVEDPNELKELLVAFFADLYRVDNEVNPRQVLSLVEPKVTQEMNEGLTEAFSDKEISDALFQMGPLKALGPDGFPARFYQRHWAIVKDDVVHAVRKFFHDGNMPEGINDTCIVLILKGNDPEELTDFRPISLCNVVYKIISKCIANRLRMILDVIINPEQCAFVPSRRITDNAIIAFKCAQEIQRSNGRRGDFCAYKLDLSKAYDQVNWGFLKQVMMKLGFHSKFLQWVMVCVTTVRYSVCLCSLQRHYVESLPPLSRFSSR